MAVVVASTDLIRVACRTPWQMYLVNALCWAWESADKPGSDAAYQGDGNADIALHEEAILDLLLADLR